MAADNRKTREQKVRATEEILAKYIFERRQPLAALALETLLELDPDHPNTPEDRAWIAEIEQEATRQARVEQLLVTGRAALAREDFDAVRAVLKRLQQVPSNPAATALAAELAEAERAQLRQSDVEQHKIDFDTLLAAGAWEEAAAQIDVLAGLGIPKVSLDFLRQRLAGHQAQQRDARSRTRLEQQLEQAIAAGDWRTARDKAHAVEPVDGALAAAMLERIGRLETTERRHQTIAEGIATLERFIDQGRKPEATLALEVLRDLEIDAATLARFRQRVNRL